MREGNRSPERWLKLIGWGVEGGEFEDVIKVACKEESLLLCWSIGTAVLNNSDGCDALSDN